MDFLLVGILVIWSFVASFLPVREKLLRAIMVANAMLTALALVALATPAISGTPTILFDGIFAVDRLRGLFLIPLAGSWVALVVGFALWWGASFQRGTAARPLFCLRSYTLVGMFIGLLIVLLTQMLWMVLVGVFIVLSMMCIEMLFQVSEQALQEKRNVVVGLGAAYLALVVSVTLLILVHMTNEARTVTLGVLASILFGFSLMWFLGLLPGMHWYRKGVAHLPKGHRALMRACLPVVFFPHILALTALGGEPQAVLMQKMFLLFGVFSLITLFEYIYIRESLAAIVAVFMWSVAFVSMGYGSAGAIPASMMLVLLPIVGTLIILAQGGVFWKGKIKKYARMIFMSIPFVSPIFVPLVLSTGYGIQIMPIVTLITTICYLVALYVLSGRIFQAWSEEAPQYTQIWNARIGGVMLVSLTLYGCWFMYTDTLSLFVDAIGGI